VKAQAAVVLKALTDGRLVARSEAFLKVVAAEAALKHYLPLIEKGHHPESGAHFPGADTPSGQDLEPV
jgi:hypothetical protein